MRTPEAPDTLDRRRFLRLAGAAVAGAVAGCRGGEEKPVASSPARITRLAAYEVEAERWKVVGKNARLPVHGKTAKDRILVIETSDGLQAMGSCFASREDAARLLRRDPLAFYSPSHGILSPLGSGDAPLFDLVGKILEEPAWRLLGGNGPEEVPVYDGSIYFNDLEPEYAGEGVDRLIYEVDEALDAGHRAFKIKVGRGHKWMEKEAGLERDVEVVRAIRSFAGTRAKTYVKLMVDANNGYDLETTRRFLDAVDDELYFVEEMFPESVEEDLLLKGWLRERGWKTLVADGESAREVDHFSPYIEARALDVLQADIRRFGFTRLLELSRLARHAGIALAPHNWGSCLGLYMQLELARGIPNFLIAEQDPATTPVFETPGFELREGVMSVPDTPGCGVVFRPERAPGAVRKLWEES